jgi:RHS repeat-associated protein
MKFTTLLTALGAMLLTPMAALALQTERAYTPAVRYNVAGQVAGTIAPDPDGSGPLRYLATRNTYDSHGFLAKVERGELSAWLDESISPQNWLNSATFAISITTEFTYDDHGRKSAEIVRGTDGTIESLVQYSYGLGTLVECKAVRMNRAVCASGPAGPDGSDRITRYTYDGLDQLGREDRAVGVAGLEQAYVTNTYSHRQLRAQTDANGNRTELRYDGYGRLSRRVYPHPTAPGAVNESDYNEYTYYDNGNLRTERKRDGSTITYAYDGLNRPITKDFSDLSMPDVYYNYDLRGLTLYSRFSGDGGTGETNLYNGFGDLSSRVSNVSEASRAITYRHDANGNRTRVTHPDGHFFEYGFDGLNRAIGVASSVTAAPDSGTAPLLSVNYSSDGRRHTIVRPVGMTTTYLRDNAARLDSFRQTFPTAADSLENVFQYNPASQIRQLVQGNDQYNFREVANRTGAYVPNGLNQYQSVNGNPLSYDAKGNLIADGGMTYRYDMENHLVETGGSKVSTLTYDTLGRLAQIAVDGTTTQFLYDGDALIGEYVNGSMTRRYVHGDQVDEPWVQFNGAGVGSADRRYLFADHQGSVIVQSSNDGAVLAKNKYDPFGIPAAGNVDRFGYTGQTWLKELGINYYKARMYSPNLGRFLQTDPIFYADDFNLYAYVGNSPVSAADPTGHAKCPDGTTTSHCTVHGTPQKTNGPHGQAHADESVARGQQRIASGEAKSVHYNQSLRTVTGDPNASNQRGDVTTVKTNGRIDIDEVTSPSQSNASQQAKGEAMLKTLPEEHRGTATASPPPGVKPRGPTNAPGAPAPAPGPRLPTSTPGGGVGRALGPVGIAYEIVRIILDGTQDPCQVAPGCA